ncbi:uncharacterized protein LOC142143048 [Mixophyes fleayi]|uniref:uncharacterized protein LOC142143048 n=1 Tax=Mixophyes fleayi TaxID=3061075 RepID=UPI003F4DA7C9
MAGSIVTPGDLYHNNSIFSEPQYLTMGVSLAPVQHEHPGDVKVWTAENCSTVHWEPYVPVEQQVQVTESGKESGQSLRRRRTTFSAKQLYVLERFFQVNKYPNINHREELAKCVFVPEPRIQVWFQNRRAKASRERKNVKKPVLIEYFPTGNHSTQPPTATPQQKTTRKWTKAPKNSNQDLLPPSHLSDYSLFSYASPSQSLQMPQVSPEGGYQHGPNGPYVVSQEPFNSKGQVSPSSLHIGNSEHFYNTLAPVMEFGN